MTLPFGRLRLVLAIAITPARRGRLSFPSAAGASDAELAKLARRRDADLARADTAIRTAIMGPYNGR